MTIFQQITSTFGAAIALPIIIFVFELVLRVKPAKAIRSAIYIGVGLNGLISILNSAFIGLMKSAMTLMIQNATFKFEYVETGWSVLASLAFSTTIGAIILPLGIAVNLLLLGAKLTDTLDVDIWNFWQWSFSASLVYYVTGSFVLGALTAVVMEMFTLLLADITAKSMQRHFDLPGLTFPHSATMGGALIALILRKPLEAIGVMKVKLDSASIRKKFGIFGDSVVVGFVIAIIIGFIAYNGHYNELSTYSSILSIGLGTGAYIYLYPKAGAVLLEGFNILSERVKEILMKKKVDREINFGMDAALCIGHSDTITTGLLSMITCVGLVFFLPGNKVLLLADLGVAPFALAAGTVAVMGGNILASYIATVVALTITLYMSSAISPFFCHMVSTLGLQVTTDIGGAALGADVRPLYGLFYYVGKNPIVLALFAIGTVIVMYLTRKKPQLKDTISGYKEDE